MKKRTNNMIEQSLQDNRARNSARTIVVQIVSTSVVTIGPFFLRSFMMHELGMELLGLNSLYQTIMGVLNISEMGFGQVMVYFLFEPLARGNIEKVNALLAYMQNVYQVIGCVFFLSGMALAFFLPVIVDDPAISLSKGYLYFFLYLIAGGMNYFCFMETLTLLNALQRLDVHYILSICVNIGVYSAQAVSLMIFHSYAVYLGILILQTCAMGLLRKFIVCRMFPQFQPEGMVSRGERNQIRVRITSVVGHQVDEKLLNSVDNLFITAFWGLSAVAIYGNYFYVVTVVNMFIEIVFNTLLSAIGNAIVMESTDSNYYRFECVFWINSILAGWAAACMYCMYDNFIYIWTGDCQLGQEMVILFCVYFYILQIRKSVLLFRNAAGMWYNDRFKPYISMLADIILDIILIRMIGLKGAVISSIFCILVIEAPWETRVLFRDYFKCPPWSYVQKSIVYTIISIILIFIVSGLCDLFFSGYGIKMLAMRFFLCSLCMSFAYFVIYHRGRIFHTWKETVKKALDQ